MKRFISTEHDIQAPAEKVWQAIAKGDQVETWLPIIKSSALVGDNKRACELVEGGLLKETILASEGTRTFMYSIDEQEAFPAKNILGTMRVAEIGENASKLYWDVEMQSEDDRVFAELEANIRQVYALSAQKLQSLN